MFLSGMKKWRIDDEQVSSKSLLAWYSIGLAASAYCISSVYARMFYLLDFRTLLNELHQLFPDCCIFWKSQAPS